jgi:uncharacterized protein
MSTQIFVNLPVKHLNKSIDFFTQLGFSFNTQFTDDTTACMIVSDHSFVMLWTEDKFKIFTPNTLCDATKSTEVLVCLSSESREAVDAMISKAIAAGGTSRSELQAELQDDEFMYERAFQDLDGHIWVIMFMEPSTFEVIPIKSPAIEG